MLNILLTFASSVFSFVFRQAVLKFLVVTVIFIIVEELSKVLLKYIPSVLSLNQYFSLIPGDLWYFLDLLAFSNGFPLVLSAYVTGFLIRRLPIIG